MEGAKRTVIRKQDIFSTQMALYGTRQENKQSPNAKRGFGYDDFTNSLNQKMVMKRGSELMGDDANS